MAPRSAGTKTGGIVLGRRRAREVALQVLFEVDVGQTDPEAAFRAAIVREEVPEKETEFVARLVRGTLERVDEIDYRLSQLATDWSLDRMANVDRNVLRLAAFEMLFLEDVPVNVSINEAVELAKAYGTAESGKFVNGILGNLVRQYSNVPGT